MGLFGRFLAAISTVALAGGAPAQDTLATARELYAGAAYEEALARLNQLRTSSHRSEDDVAIEQYRAFCLLALGRAQEAEVVVTTLVQTAPWYFPSSADASPRIQSTFRDIRRRLLPAIIQRKYEEAKASFDRKDPRSADAFKLVIELIDDPDLGGAPADPQLAQLRTLAVGFRDLSVKPAAPAAPVVQPARQALPIAQVPSNRPAPIRIYSMQDSGIVPPSVVRQSFAPLADVFALRQGAVEIVVDETGTVVGATTQTAVNAVYDRIALATAKSWRYRPATLNGVAVKFRMVVRIEVKPSH